MQSWPVRHRQPRMVELLTLVDEALDLQRDLDLDSSPHIDDPSVERCAWCGTPVEEDWLDRDMDHWIDLTMDQYWGPLQFDEIAEDDWDVGLLVADEWRWLRLHRPYDRDDPYEMSGWTCSVRCLEHFMAALRRDTAARRPH